MGADRPLPDAWQRAVARLREVRLLAPAAPATIDALDAHPLVREWFGERLKATNEPAWRAAHDRLYEHLRDNTQEGKAPTLADLAPLYQAIAHGCRAGRHNEALHKIYANRICRREPDFSLAFYTQQQLGAFGSNLAALAWFFEPPYVTPVGTLMASDRSWVLAEAAVALRAQGRLVEGLLATRAALAMVENAQDWRNAAIQACNLSDAELTVGGVAAAVTTAEQSVVHADHSGDEFCMMASRAAHADALHAAGRQEEAAQAFADAERRQKERQPDYPLLNSLPGYQLCDLLMAQYDHARARDRASQTLQWAREHRGLLAIALDTLILGRAHLGLVLTAVGGPPPNAVTRDEASTARARLDDAVDGLRAAGQGHHIPSGLLARAAFRRSVGDSDGASCDVDEAQEIAEPGPMRLYLCDIALERARLAFARSEAFAPLNGLIDDSPPKPERLDEAERKELRDEVATQLARATAYIQKCSYHRRDAEVAELLDVLGGVRSFASLLPRV